jgi:hypothetical protein
LDQGLLLRRKCHNYLTFSPPILLLIHISNDKIILEVHTLKKNAFLSFSLLLLMVIPGCITVQAPPITPAGTPPVILVFSNNPSTINAGGTSTLLWNVTGATSVSIDQGIGQVDVAGIRVISPAASTVYTISAINSAGTATRSAATIVNSVPLPPPPMPFAVTSVIANTSPTNFTGACPKTFTYYASITANGPGAVTYRWERSDGKYSDVQAISFYEAGTKTATMQWDLSESSSGWYRIHVLTPYDAASNPVYYTLKCDGSLVTGIIVGVDQYPFTGPCPKTIRFWGTISTSGPGVVTYRWERSDNITATAPETIIFTAAGAQTVTNLWTRGEGTGWQRLHILTPNDAISSQIDFVMTCWDQTQ